MGTLDDIIVAPRKWGKTPIDAWAQAEHFPPATRQRREWLQRYRARAVISDVVLAGLAGLLAYFVRFRSGSEPTYAALTAATPLIWIVATYVARVYESRYLGSGTEEY